TVDARGGRAGVHDHHLHGRIGVRRARRRVRRSGGRLPSRPEVHPVTTVEFQPDTGHLRLGRATFDQLVRWYADRGDPGRAGPIPAALSAAGAADPHGNLAPPVDLAFSAVTGAICQLAIEVRRVDTDTGDGAEESGSGWVTGDAATLLLPLPDGRHELGLVHPTFLPAMLLRVVELG